MHVQIIRTSRDRVLCELDQVTRIPGVEGRRCPDVVALHVQVVHDVEQVATFEVEDGDLERDAHSALASRSFRYFTFPSLRQQRQPVTLAPFRRWMCDS
jgi:hypothetical protein